jgi:hypothetical protein
MYKWKIKAFSVVFAYLSLCVSKSKKVLKGKKDSKAFIPPLMYSSALFSWGFFMNFKYFIQHSRPSDATVPEDAGIEPRTVSTSALAVRRSNLSAKSHPHLFSFHSCL